MGFAVQMSVYTKIYHLTVIVETDCLAVISAGRGVAALGGITPNLVIL